MQLNASSVELIVRLQMESAWLLWYRFATRLHPANTLRNDTAENKAAIRVEDEVKEIRAKRHSMMEPSGSETDGAMSLCWWLGPRLNKPGTVAKLAQSAARL